MINIIKKLKVAAHNTTTYRAGLLQTKAYRILKQHTTKLLSQHDITTVEWAMLGLLYDNKKGLRASALAYELGVEAPFITQIVNRIKKTAFIGQVQDAEDSRAKILQLTPKGRAFVDSTERYLRDETRSLFRGIPFADLMTYLSVMQAIIDNE